MSQLNVLPSKEIISSAYSMSTKSSLGVPGMKNGGRWGENRRGRVYDSTSASCVTYVNPFAAVYTMLKKYPVTRKADRLSAPRTEDMIAISIMANMLHINAVKV